MTRLSRLAGVAALAAFLLIVLGGMARGVTGGAGCGDSWPMCQGSWWPPLEPSALLDYLHRAVSASVGMIVFATALVALSTREASGRVRAMAAAAFATIVLQSVLGGVAVRLGWPAWSGPAHLAAALVVFGLTLATAIDAALEARPPRSTQDAAAPFDPWLVRLAQGAGVATLVVILGGASTGVTAVAVACTSWPFCPDGGVHPADLASGNVAPRLAVGVVTLLALLAAWAARSAASPAVRLLAIGGAGLAGAQWLLGPAANGGAAWAGPAALATLTLLWAAMVGVVAISAGGALAPVGGAAFPPALTHDEPSVERWLERAIQTVRDYAALTKPGILTLLLTTTLCAMLVAAAGIPPFGLVLATMIGGVLAAGGANVLNCYIDRDIDRQMPRTRHRATVAGRIGPGTALAYGLTLSVLAVLVYGRFVNWTAAWLALAGNLFYVLIYTAWLKRRTPQNIVIGGAAGAVPPLVGWAAVTGGLAPLAWGLFAIVFFWTPPHFWALALLKQGEYGRAAVPMLPNVAGERETRKQIVIYTAILTLTCLALVPFGLGPIYLAAAVALNGIFLWLAVRLWLAPSKRLARQLFFYSLWYLAFIFAAAVIDRLVFG